MLDPALLAILDDLQARLEPMRFKKPAAYVYNPCIYAREPFLDYFERYGQGEREVLMLGMNPGPWGMGQTGVPFGAVNWVRDWLGVRGEVGRPAREHPKKPVEGFECGRVEVSGDRLWGWVADRWESPERFFERFFVYNYCPLLFLNERGANVTPNRLRVAQRRPLLEACDATLARLVERMKPRWVVGVGRFAERRARAVLEGSDVQVASILHPSPASPAANRGWRTRAEADFEAAGLRLDTTS